MATTGPKIDSPFAQYNGLQLTCKLCNSQVKSSKVWTAHVNGKQHREKLLELKSRKSQPEIFKVPAKRNGSLPSETVATKKFKKSEDNASNDEIAGSILPQDFFDSSFNPDSSKAGSSKSTTTTIKQTTNDKSVANNRSSSTLKDVEISSVDKEKDGASSSTSLPEGFFDDKKLDAKARNVELKDPLDEEWSKFQKEMQQVQNVTDTIVEEDDERFHLERTLDEIEDELRGWAKINELEKKVEKIIIPSESETSRQSTKATVFSAEDDFNGDTSEDITLEEMMDWRSKQLWK